MTGPRALLTLNRKGSRRWRPWAIPGECRSNPRPERADNRERANACLTLPREPRRTERASTWRYPRADGTGAPGPGTRPAVLGFRNYWYPVLWSREVGKHPVPVTLLGENIMLVRDNGRIYALHDRCPHRGVPLTLGAGWLGQRSWSRQEFPGTISCGYHGWTYDLKTGVLCAALTDGPDSPICGKVRVRTYPVEERLGLIWIYVGDIEPPPIEQDIPRS